MLLDLVTYEDGIEVDSMLLSVKYGVTHVLVSNLTALTCLKGDVVGVASPIHVMEDFWEPPEDGGSFPINQLSPLQISPLETESCKNLAEAL